MAKYSIEDIEILRRKSGISYEEAVSLLEYHNGSLARALVDLEKNGRLKNDTAPKRDHRGWKRVLHYLYCLRLIIKKDQVVILNLSMLFLLFIIFTAAHVCLIGAVLALVLGYQIRFESRSRDFLDADLDEMVRNAKKNVQESVNSFAKQFAREETQKTSDEEPPRSESAASGTRPVSVPFSEGGRVDVRDGGDGYHEADIQ